MTWVEGAVLGLVQGLTEFLPVSSSGHLVLAQTLLGVNPPGLTLEITVHLATMAAVAAAFWRDLARIVAAAFRALAPRGRVAPSPGEPAGRPGGRRAAPPRGWSDPSLRLLVWLAAGTVPAALAGLAFEDWFAALFSSPRAVGWALMVTGLLLVLPGRKGREGRGLDRLGVRDALVVGVLQAAALAPGLSRSGATIAGGLLSGLDRDASVRFSFLLSVPAVLGAGLLDLTGWLSGGASGATALAGVSDPRLLLSAAGAAALSGYAAIRLVVASVRAGRLGWFALYCWALGAAALGLGRF
ncbi:MAG: undecaprenyl-diphosphate phosphatase [Acetobacteraceae bacterium]|nr:undecaprenyl-diphosphate phosphatase [Acetobacteraceae bacterium]